MQNLIRETELIKWILEKLYSRFNLGVSGFDGSSRKQGSEKRGSDYQKRSLFVAIFNFLSAPTWKQRRRNYQNFIRFFLDEENCEKRSWLEIVSPQFRGVKSLNVKK